MHLHDQAYMPTAGQVMTPFPHFVDADDRLTEVREKMEKHDLRHLPVKEDGQLVGIISDRDVTRLTNPALPRSDLARIHARAVMSRDPFIVSVDAPLAEVLEAMAERRLGTALLEKDGRLAGILSVTDVCRVLALFLRDRYETTGVA